jgi:UDP-N-acetylglucosamine acyltransferase
MTELPPAIHPTAIIEDGAIIGKSCKIGPYCCVGSDVTLDDSVILESNIVISGKTFIGKGTKIWPFASVGSDPQDLKYAGEKTALKIGKNNLIRECVSISVGTDGGGGITSIGDNCLFMLGSHVGHDCKLGNNIVIANNSAIAGHVTIEDNVNIGGLVGVHQFCRIGEGAMIGAHAMVSKDVIPFSLIVGMRPVLSGVNLIGLKRRGCEKANIKKLVEVFSKIFERQGKKSFQERLKAIDENNMYAINEVQKVLEFMKKESTRSFVAPKS